MKTGKAVLRTQCCRFITSTFQFYAELNLFSSIIFFVNVIETPVLWEIVELNDKMKSIFIAELSPQCLSVYITQGKFFWTLIENILQDKLF